MKWLRLFALLLLPSLAYAQVGRMDGIALGYSGRPQPGALISVCTQPATMGSSTTPCSPLATTYTDSTGSTVCNGLNGCANPITADGNGNWHFYASTTTVYSLQFYGPGITPYLQVDQRLAGAVGSSSSGSLGNGSTVIDPSQYSASTDLYAITLAAIAKCSSGPCTYDYRAYNGKSLTISQSPTWPTGSVVQMCACTTSLANGISLIPPPQGGTISGPALGTWTLNRQAGDSTTPLIGMYDTTSSLELSHVYLVGTNSAAISMPVTDVDTTTNGTVVTAGYYIGYSAVTGSAGQTCNLAIGALGATGTVALTKTNYIQPGTPLVITAGSSGYGTGNVSATLSNGTATCSGSSTVEVYVGDTIVDGTFSATGLASPTTCAANACVGLEVGVWGFIGQNSEGFFPIIASSATQLHIAVTGVISETPAPAWPMYYPYAIISGGWLIKKGTNAVFVDNTLADLTGGGDLGIGIYNSGSNLYNNFERFSIGTRHGSLFIGSNAYSNNYAGVMNLNASDQNVVGYPSAVGFCFRGVQGGYSTFEHLNCENSKYSIYVKGGGSWTFSSLYIENDPALLTYTSQGFVSLPIIGPSSAGNWFPPKWQVLDESGYPSTYNYYSTGTSSVSVAHQHYNSVDKIVIPVATGGAASAVCPSGACATPYQYYVVVHDLNWPGGVSTKNSTAPVAYSPVNNNASLDSTHYNRLTYPGSADSTSARCFDVLVGDTAHYLKNAATGANSLCIPASIYTFNDDGSFTPTAYTAPARDSTSDIQTENGWLLGQVVAANQGAACTNGELALSAGWQSTGSATVTAVHGDGQTCSWTITTGTTTAANPTVTDTLTNPLPDAGVICELNIHGGTHTAAAGEGFYQSTFSATAPVFTFNGTPTANGFTYFVTRRCGP